MAPFVLSACRHVPESTSAVPQRATAATAAPHLNEGRPTDPRLSVVNDTTARTDVALTSCAGAFGSWVASGKVTNSTSAAATYDIEITYTDAHSTVLGVEKTIVTASPKQTQSWRATWPSSMTSGVTCVLNAVSRSA
jgi:hypothetical protein